MLFVVSLGEMWPNIYGESRTDVAGLFALGGALGSGHVAVLDNQPYMHLSIAACKRYHARAHECRPNRQIILWNFVCRAAAVAPTGALTNGAGEDSPLAPSGEHLQV